MPQRLYIRVEAPVLHDGMTSSRLIRYPDEIEAAVERFGERLLGEYVAAKLHRSRPDLVMAGRDGDIEHEIGSVFPDRFLKRHMLPAA